MAIAYYDSRDGSTVQSLVSYEDVFEDTARDPISLADAFPLGNLDPNFDTNYANCFGLGGPDVMAFGSGFFFAWSDGRDPGPAGNNGIDPNIYFTHDIGPFLDTAMSLAVAKTSSKLMVSGSVSPRPVPNGEVTITLSRSTGDGFELVEEKTATTNKKGDFSMSFARPSGGTCRVTAAFLGSEGREPSPAVTKTFAC